MMLNRYRYQGRAVEMIDYMSNYTDFGLDPARFDPIPI